MDMNKRQRFIALCVAMFLAVGFYLFEAGTVFGDEAITYKIVVTVTDENGDPADSATVYCNGTEVGTTDTYGEFEFRVVSGNYTIFAQKGSKSGSARCPVTENAGRIRVDIGLN